MNLKQWCVLSMLACTLSSADVTSAADLSVNGQIRTGGACSIALGNGGVIDLGNLSKKELPNGNHLNEISRDMPLTINCRHPVRVGIDVIDNRGGTMKPGMIDGGFGLGNIAIGGYYLRGSYSGGGEADGRPVIPIRRKSGETRWNYYGAWRTDVTTSWGDPWVAVPEPVAFKTLKDTLGISVLFRGDIAFTDELEIDGSATLELVYL